MNREKEIKRKEIIVESMNAECEKKISKNWCEGECINCRVNAKIEEIQDEIEQLRRKK